MTPSLSNDYFQTLGGISSKEKTEIIVLVMYRQLTQAS